MILEDHHQARHDGHMMLSNIRCYRREDFNALVALYQCSKGDEFRFESGWPDCFPVIPLTHDETRLKTFSDCDVRVALDGGELAGVIYWQGHRIVGLLVNPETRGKGIGRALMMAALDRIKEERVTLGVVASNMPAIRLYESMRFQVMGQRTGVYQGVPVTLLTMRRGPAGRV